MAIQKPPSLACIGAFDGLNDPYRAGIYHGGILGDFFRLTGGTRIASSTAIRPMADRRAIRPTTESANASAHPTYDEFWRERMRGSMLDRIKVPLYSSRRLGQGAVCIRAAISTAIRRASGAEKAADDPGPVTPSSQPRNSPAVELHETRAAAVLRSLSQGQEHRLFARPNVEYFVRGADAMRSAETWPPPGVTIHAWHLERVDVRQRHVDQ